MIVIYSKRFALSWRSTTNRAPTNLRNKQLVIVLNGNTKPTPHINGTLFRSISLAVATLVGCDAIFIFGVPAAL